MSSIRSTRYIAVTTLPPLSIERKPLHLRTTQNMPKLFSRRSTIRSRRGSTAYIAHAAGNSRSLAEIAQDRGLPAIPFRSVCDHGVELRHIGLKTRFECPATDIEMMQGDSFGRERKMIHVRLRTHRGRETNKAQSLHCANGKFKFLVLQSMPIQYFIEIEEHITLESFGVQRAQ